MKKGSAEGNDQKISVLRQYPLFRITERGIAAIETASNLVTVGFIMFIMLFAAGEIVGRYVFNHPIPGHVEIVELLMAAVVFLGIAYTQRVKSHIRMELFIVKVLRGRAYHIAEALTLSMALFAYGTITVGSFLFALDAYQIGDMTTYIYWPTWPSKICIPIGSFMLCVRFFLQLIQHVAQATTGVEIKNLE